MSKFNITKPEMIDGGLKETIEKISVFLEKKDKSYGTKNLVALGELGLFIRAHDKFARLISYYNNETDMDIESVNDAWRDICGYAIQWLRFFDD